MEVKKLQNHSGTIIGLRMFWKTKIMSASVNLLALWEKKEVETIYESMTGQGADQEMQ